MNLASERGRHTQREFRYANGRFFDALTNSTSPDGQLIPFLCECADEGCMGRVEITAWRYASRARRSWSRTRTTRSSGRPLDETAAVAGSRLDRTKALVSLATATSRSNLLAPA